MNARNLLIASLVLNIGLIGAAAWLFKSRSTTASKTELSQPAPITEAPRSVAAAPAANSVEKAAPGQHFDWRLVESEDYKKYIANLRSIGCPEETIRDIITADVKKLFDSRRKSLTGSTNKFEFWKSGNMFGAMLDEEKIKQSQELSKEKRALLKELLGVEPEEKPDLLAGMNPFDTMLDFLPASKQADVMDIFQKFQAKMAKTFSGGTPDAEDMKKMQNSQKEMEAELAKVLSPQEMEDYQLRLSQTAMVMRMQLASFDPSEQEFRDIFKAKKKFDDEFGPFGMLSQDKETKAKYDSAKKELDAGIKSTLGDNRYGEYEMSQDFTYQGIYRVADRNGLGKDAAVKVYDMKKAAEQQAMQVRNDASLSTDQRAQALSGIRAETENSIRTVFGDTAWQSYQKQPGAYWMKAISPDP
jgi:uncharacterized membrane protein